MCHSQTQPRMHSSRVRDAESSFSEMSGDGLSPLRPARLSRSYVTLLTAAAEEARALTPNDIARRDGSGVSGGDQGGGGGGGRGEVLLGDSRDVSLTLEGLARAGEERMRRLEAENLRLRFRVADLEGQVCVFVCLCVSVCTVCAYKISFITIFTVGFSLHTQPCATC